MILNLLDLASRAVFVFGALTFSILTIFYWGETRRRRGFGRSTAFPAFTLACAVAFLDSLALQVIIPRGAGAPLATLAILIHGLTAGLLPALMFHVVFEIESGRLPGRRRWN